MKANVRTLSLLCLCIILLFSEPLWAQPTPVTSGMPEQSGINQGRFIGVVVSTAAFYTITLLLLRKQWYKKKVPFHLFNDNREWLQMDKAGHMATAYCMSRGGYELMRWSGVNERASVLTGGLLALLFQTTLEVYDGHGRKLGIF